MTYRQTAKLFATQSNRAIKGDRGECELESGRVIQLNVADKDQNWITDRLAYRESLRVIGR